MRLKDYEKYDDFYVAVRRLRDLKEDDPYWLIAHAAIENKGKVTYGRWVNITIKRGRIYIKPHNTPYGIRG